MIVEYSEMQRRILAYAKLQAASACPVSTARTVWEEAGVNWSADVEKDQGDISVAFHCSPAQAEVAVMLCVALVQRFHERGAEATTDAGQSQCVSCAIEVARDLEEDFSGEALHRGSVAAR